MHFDMSSAKWRSFLLALVSSSTPIVSIFIKWIKLACTQGAIYLESIHTVIISWSLLVKCCKAPCMWNPEYLYIVIAYDDVIKWKHFPRYWPFVRGIHRSPVSFDVFFVLRLDKQLSKQPWGWWFETISHPLWRHRNELISVNSLRASDASLK